jgi:hypothetical protein
MGRKDSMFKRLNLCGNDIVRTAEPRVVDPDQQGGVGWISYDWDDLASREGTAFRRLSIKRSPGGRRTLWRRGDPLR